MHSQALLATLLATFASAEVMHPAIIAARGGADFIARQAAPSTTGSGGTIECATDVLSIITSIPRPPSDVASWIQSAPAPTNPCSVSVPDSISSDYSSWSTEAVSWYSSNSADLLSALSKCPNVGDIAGDISSVTNICTSVNSVVGAGQTTSGAGQTTGAGSSPSNTAGAASPSTTPNAAHKDGAMVGMAVAAAGFLGVVAAL